MNIEIITTPTKDLLESGFGNYKSCQNVLNSIQRMGHNCRLRSCRTLLDLKKVSWRNPDLVVLAVKYIKLDCGEKVWLSEFFSQCSIAHTGSSRHALEYDSNKALAKHYLKRKGIPTAEFFLAAVGQYRQQDKLPIEYPLFLKPNLAANGNGVSDLSFVSCYKDFNQKIYSLQKSYGEPILVERYLSGREYTVAILDTAKGPPIVSGVEIFPPISDKGHRILTGKIKRDNSEALVEITDNKVKDIVSKIAMDAYVELGAEGFARIDIKADSSGKLYFIEANLVPGMTRESSYFPEAFRIGLKQSYDETIAHMIEHSLNNKVPTSPSRPPHLPTNMINHSMMPTYGLSSSTKMKQDDDTQ